jgi:hypothetical protein
LISESDNSVLDIVLEIEVAKRVRLYANVEVLLQLQAHEAPVLEHLLVKQVAADPRHNFEATTVPTIEASSVDELASRTQQTLKSHIGS